VVSGLPNMTPIFSRIWLMKIRAVRDLETVPVSLRRACDMRHWIGVQPAYVFGVFAFTGEFVPIIGPVVVAIPALLVAASMGVSHFFLALLAILFVQQVETNVLIPFVMGRQMDLHPVIIMFFTLAMGTLFGAIGAVLVVPAAALCKILVGEFYLHNRHEDKRQFDAEAREIVTRRVKEGGN
jgi:predicted PurR-regulated permease PerM